MKQGRSLFLALAFAVPLGAAVGNAPAIAQQAQGGIASQLELAFWQSVMGSDDRAQYEAYLAQFPNGTFAPIARLKIAAIDRRANPSPPAVAVVQAVPQTAASPAPAPAAQPAPQISVTLPAQSAAVATAPVATAPAAVAPAKPAEAEADALPNYQQLHDLGQTQGLRSDKPVPAPKLPKRPDMAAVPAVALPAQFCSAVERNAFYDTTYKSAIDLADGNNQMAIAYLNEVQSLYDAAGKTSDFDLMNLLSAEAKAYKPIAADAFSARTSMDSIFPRLMAVPIVKC